MANTLGLLGLWCVFCWKPDGPGGSSAGSPGVLVGVLLVTWGLWRASCWGLGAMVRESEGGHGPGGGFRG